MVKVKFYEEEINMNKDKIISVLQRLTDLWESEE